MVEAASSQAQMKVRRYWNVDGLHEIAAGLIFGLTAVCAWGAHLTGPKSVLDIAFPVILIGGILAEKPVVNAIRKRMTYPRTGYVAFRRAPKRLRYLTAAIAALVAAGMAFAIARHPHLPDRWLVGILSLFVGMFCAQVARQSGVPRFYAVGLASAATGVVITLYGLDFERGEVAYFGAIAVVLIVSGGLTLRQYLHTAPAPAVE